MDDLVFTVLWYTSCCMHKYGDKDIYWLMARALTGEASNKELAWLEYELKLDEELRQRYTTMQRFWQTKSLSKWPTERKERSLKKIFEKVLTAPTDAEKKSQQSEENSA